MEEITICQVLSGRVKSGNSWVITRCDRFPDQVGNITNYGMPYRAKDLPVGSKFETKLTIPETGE